MPDITLCPGQGCPLKNQCYRFRAKVYGRQDYFGSLPYKAATGTCDSFDDLANYQPTHARISHLAYMLWQSAGRPLNSADADWQRARESLEATFAEGITPPAPE